MQVSHKLKIANAIARPIGETKFVAITRNPHDFLHARRAFCHADKALTIYRYRCLCLRIAPNAVQTIATTDGQHTQCGGGNPKDTDLMFTIVSA